MAKQTQTRKSLQDLQEEYSFEMSEFKRWITWGSEGLHRMRDYLHLKPAPPALAFIAYELVADLRHHPDEILGQVVDTARSNTSDEVEVILSDIRIHFATSKAY